MGEKISTPVPTAAMFVNDNHLRWSANDHGEEGDSTTVQEFSWQFLHAGSQHEAIDLYISSGGGAATAMCQIHDLINAVPAHVSVTAMGMVGSAAFYLTVTGPKGYRRALPSTTFMWHEASMFLNGGQRNLLNYMEFSKVEDARVRDEIIENSNLTADKYDELFSGDDVFLTAQQALDYGLIDEIVDTIDPVPFNDELKAEYLKPEECEHDDAPCVDIEDENGEPDPATS